MKSKLMILATIASLLFGGLNASASAANPVDVKYNITGSSGEWFLAFTLYNNLTEGGLYFFGVQVANGVYSSTKSGWITGSPYTASENGVTYNLPWINDNAFTGNNVTSGASSSDFVVKVNDVSAPTSVDWFTYAIFANTTGQLNQGNMFNPGFVGTATAVTAVPGPEAGAGLGTLAVGGMAVWLKRRRGGEIVA